MVKCSDCSYWFQEKANNFGQCRRRAPQPVNGPVGAFIGPHNVRATWPYTRDTDGCGDGVSMVRVIPEETQDQTIVRDTRPPTLNPFNAAVEKARNE